MAKMVIVRGPGDHQQTRQPGCQTIGGPPSGPVRPKSIMTALIVLNNFGDLSRVFSGIENAQ